MLNINETTGGEKLWVELIKFRMKGLEEEEWKWQTVFFEKRVWIEYFNENLTKIHQNLTHAAYTLGQWM